MADNDSPRPPEPPAQDDAKRGRGKRLLFRFALVAVLAIVVVVAGLSLARIAARSGTDGAVATMSPPPPPPPAGRSGFAELMRYDYDVSAERMETALADAVAWRAAMLPLTPDDPGAPANDPLDELPRRPTLTLEQVCPVAGCLAWVRDHAQDVRTLVDVESARIAISERAWQSAHLRNPFPEPAVLPPYQSFRLLLTATAWDATEGRAEAAYERTCGLFHDARRLSLDARSLIERALGVAFTRGAAELLLDLRRDYPVDALPAACAGVVETTFVDEVAICEPMRGEYRALAAATDRMAAWMTHRSPMERIIDTMQLDPELQKAWFAESLAAACREDTRAAARGGRILENIGEWPPEPYGVRCYTAYRSCMHVMRLVPATLVHARNFFNKLAIRQLLLAGQRVADGEGTPREIVGDRISPEHPVRWDASGMKATLRLEVPGEDTEEWTLDFAGLAPSPAGAAPQPK